MSDDRGHSGGCLCGAVRYRIDRVVSGVLQCHCENCRRLTGNFVAAVRVMEDDLHVTVTDDALGWHHLGYARYGFCRSCGATLFFNSTERPDLYSAMVGTLDDAAGLEVEAVWFADEAQAHNTLPAGVPHHAGNG